jgi:hypothetical protein
LKDYGEDDTSVLVSEKCDTVTPILKTFNRESEAENGMGQKMVLQLQMVS